MKQKTKILTIILLSAVEGALLYVPLIQAFKPHRELVSEMTVAEFKRPNFGDALSSKSNLFGGF